MVDSSEMVAFVPVQLALLFSVHSSQSSGHGFHFRVVENHAL